MNIQKLGNSILQNIGKVIYGKEREIRLVLAAMLAGGHVLLDDIPGTGKTSMARALAVSVDGTAKRVQFTPDLLPGDITGINIFDRKRDDFMFRPGPVFADILIADEINRTTPRTQSALLEAMEERQVSVDGVTYPLSDLFFVVATENPIESQGTFPLPEAQIDRFMMRLSLGYPDRESEKRILSDHMAASPLGTLKPVCTTDDIRKAKAEARQIFVSEKISDYIVRIAEATRTSDRVRLGVSPRASLALMHVSQALAALDGRDNVLPDDVKAAAPSVLAHRIITRSQSALRLTDSAEKVIGYILDSVAAPID